MTAAGSRAALADRLLNWAEAREHGDVHATNESLTALLNDAADALAAAAADLAAVKAALAEPCAECGHIDWRSDGYLDPFIERADRAVADLAQARKGHARVASLLGDVRVVDTLTEPEARGVAHPPGVPVTAGDRAPAERREMDAAGALDPPAGQAKAGSKPVDASGSVSVPAPSAPTDTDAHVQTIRAGVAELLRCFDSEKYEIAESVLAALARLVGETAAREAAVFHSQRADTAKRARNLHYARALAAEAALEEAQKRIAELEGGSSAA